MRVFSISAIALLGLVLIPSTGHAQQQPDPEAFVRDLYVRYAGVEPTRSMIDFWLREINRGVSANDVIANVLGSDQAFNRSRRNNEIWLNSLYADLLGRQAEPGAVAHWMTRLRDLRNDRVKLAREFLKAAGSEIAVGGIRPPAQDLPTELVTATQLVLQSAQSECPGRDGWMIREQAKALATSASNSLVVLQNPEANPRQYARAITTLDASLTRFRESLGQSRLPAPNTRLHAEQAAQILATLSAAGGVVPPPGPPGVPGGLSRADARRLEQYAVAMSRETAAANATFQAVLRPDWNNRTLLRQVEAISTEADSLRSVIRGGYPLNDLFSRSRQLSASADQVSAVVSKGGIDPRVYQAWYQATAELNGFTAQVASLGSVIAPPIGGGVQVPREAFAAIDRATAECDILIAAFTPYTFYNRPSARLISDLRELKNRYAELRQVAASNATPRELQRQLDRVTDTLRSASDNWRDADRDPRFRPPTDLADLIAVDRDVSRLILSVR